MNMYKSISREFFASTEYFNYNHSLIQKKVDDLKEKAGSSLDYIERAYEFVRDEIPHSGYVEVYLEE